MACHAVAGKCAPVRNCVCTGPVGEPQGWLVVRGGRGIPGCERKGVQCSHGSEAGDDRSGPPVRTPWGGRARSVRGRRCGTFKFQYPRLREPVFRRTRRAPATPGPDHPKLPLPSSMTPRNTALDAVGGVTGRAGTVDGSGPVVAGGMVSVQSRYTAFGQLTGSGQFRSSECPTRQRAIGATRYPPHPCPRRQATGLLRPAS